ncbi:MAG: hypothetical protein Q4P66_01340 [Actinomycetaceae bacterium]|nr:hypothetical protein [Actinomycetaceae bacterium]
MALFEFEQGRLIPAQFGHPVHQGLEPDILEAIRTQVLEVIARPLFPVTWHNNDDGSIDSHRLTALDAAGQVVSVEVLARLDPVNLIAAVSKLGDIAALGWMELATRYPGGAEAFRTGWAEFRESMPPTTQPGPRLIIVVGEVDAAVRPALGVLYQSGMEIHEVRMRQMSNGRRFLEVMAVRPGVLGTSTPELVGTHVAQPQLTWGDTGEVDSMQVVEKSRGSVQMAPQAGPSYSAPAPPSGADTPDINAQQGSAHMMQPLPDQASAEQQYSSAAPDYVQTYSDSFTSGDDDITQVEPPTFPDASDAEETAIEQDAEEQVDVSLTADSDGETLAEVTKDVNEEAQMGDASHCLSNDVDTESSNIEHHLQEGEVKQSLENDNTKEETNSITTVDSEVTDKEAESTNVQSAEDASDDERNNAEDTDEEPQVGDLSESTDSDDQGETADEEGIAEQALDARVPEPQSAPHDDTDGAKGEDVAESMDADPQHDDTIIMQPVMSPQDVSQRASNGEHRAEREPVPGVIGLNAEGLYAIAQVIGQDAVLMWDDPDTGKHYEATLKEDGAIDCGDGFTTNDVEESLLKITGRGDLVGWKSWRIGHTEGPTLSEAIDEINAEIYRETKEAHERQ